MVEIITKDSNRATMVEIITKEISKATMTAAVTAPDHCYCSNQASLIRIKGRGRAGEFPVGETNRSQSATDVVMVIK